jgi:hypothetical protein
MWQRQSTAEQGLVAWSACVARINDATLHRDVYVDSENIRQRGAACEYSKNCMKRKNRSQNILRDHRFPKGRILTV